MIIFKKIQIVIAAIYEGPLLVLNSTKKIIRAANLLLALLLLWYVYDDDRYHFFYKQIIILPTFNTLGQRTNKRTTD